MRKHSFAEENHAAGKVRNANSRTIHNKKCDVWTIDEDVRAGG